MGLDVASLWSALPWSLRSTSLLLLRLTSPLAATLLWSHVAVIFPKSAINDGGTSVSYGLLLLSSALTS